MHTAARNRRLEVEGFLGEKDADPLIPSSDATETDKKGDLAIDTARHQSKWEGKEAGVLLEGIVEFLGTAGVAKEGGQKKGGSGSRLEML